MLDRRQLVTGFAVLAGSAGLVRPRAAFAQTAPVFTLPPLGYAFEALEPHIDTATMRIHHGAHHQAYVNNANALAGQWEGLRTTPIETVLADLGAVPEAVRAGVRNNVGGHWNHSFFWRIMAPGGPGAPEGELSNAINGAFGSLQELTAKLNAAALGRFGSGWAWLVVGKDRKLAIVSTANQDTPLELGAKPVLGVDVWEHAYYLKHQSKRADYLAAWWKTVNWTQAAENFRKAAG